MIKSISHLFSTSNCLFYFSDSFYSHVSLKLLVFSLIFIGDRVVINFKDSKNFLSLYQNKVLIILLELSSKEDSERGFVLSNENTDYSDAN